MHSFSVKQLMLKYKELPQQIKASLWFIVSNFVIKGISFITLPIFSRLLTTEDYGIIAVYSSWTTIISIITTLTIWGGVFNVGMTKYVDRDYEMISSFQGMAVFNTIIGLIVTVILFPFLQPLFQLPEKMIILAFIDIIFQVPYNLWSGHQRYKYLYRQIIAITMTVSILNPLLGYFAVINSQNKAEARILSGLIINIVLGSVLFVYNQCKGSVFFSKHFWKWGFSFNIVLVPHYLSMQILNQSDRIMINNMCGESDTGIYSMAYNFALLLSLISTGINSSLTPHVYKSIKSGNGNQLRQQTTILIGAVAIMALGLIAFIPDVFHLLLPESYYPALKVIPPVTISAFFMFLYPLFGAVEFYYEENKYVTYASIVGAALNIILNYVFIKMFGYIGAAYTTQFCYMCFSLCHYLFMKKTMKKNGNDVDIYDMKSILFISLSLIIMSLLLTAVYDIFVIRWIIIVAILIVAFVKRKDILNTFKSLRNKSI